MRGVLFQNSLSAISMAKCIIINGDCSNREVRRVQTFGTGIDNLAGYTLNAEKQNTRWMTMSG